MRRRRLELPVGEAFDCLMGFINAMDSSLALAPLSEYINFLRDPSRAKYHDELRDHFRRLRIPLPPKLAAGEWAPNSGEQGE